MTEKTADETVGLTWEQAVEQAREKHSDLAPEEGPEAEPALETEQEDETESASEEPDSEAEGQDLETEAAKDEEAKLLSKEELAQLRKDQPALAKLIDNLETWRADLTQKSQGLAQDRRTVDALLPWAQKLQQDPKGTLVELAGLYKVDLGKKEPEAEPEPPLEELATEELKTAFNDPELDFLAERMAKPLVGLAQRIAKSIVAEELKPFQNFHREILTDKAKLEIDDAYDRFAKAYPDFKKFEPQMIEVMEKLALDKDGEPRQLNLSQYELLELAYAMATKDRKVARDAKRLIERQAKAAKKADSSRSGIPPQNVKDELPQGASFDQCVRAAKARLGAG